MPVICSQFPSGTRIVSIDSDSQITVSNNAASTSTGWIYFRHTQGVIIEETISLATLGLAVGDIVQMVVFVDSTSTWAHDVAFEFCEIEVVTA